MSGHLREALPFPESGEGSVQQYPQASGAPCSVPRRSAAPAAGAERCVPGQAGGKFAGRTAEKRSKGSDVAAPVLHLL